MPSGLRKVIGFVLKYMSQIHCYNENCINGIALRNCDHEEEDCMKNLKYPALTPERADGTHDGYYCADECKAKVVTVILNEDRKPRTPEEMKYRINRMKERYLEDQKGQKQLL